MSTWRYQPVFNTSEPDAVYLCALYFTDAGTLNGWDANPPRAPYGDDVKDLTTSLVCMLADTMRWEPIAFEDLKVGMTFEQILPDAALVELLGPLGWRQT